ncbi:hypothetical protein GGI12_002828 [Dipsacomyces acuminosporus]|nr:hypothetical protein GGI12_002828 [Dipsacomyces acuminosporus]
MYRKREQEVAKWPYLRRNLHIIFYEPSSKRARIYTIISSLVVLLFLIVFMLDTMPQYRVKDYWPRVAAIINLATAIFFGVEWLLRFYSFRNPYKYLIQPMALIDLLGIIPAFISYKDSIENHSFGHLKWLRALQVLRVLKVLRLTQYSVELYVTLRTLRRSLSQILVVMLVVAIVLITACFFMFFAENDSLDVPNVRWLRKNRGVVETSPFQNVFYCLYWGFVTVTTVGYGDLTPVSPWGQVVACITMIMGVFTIVFPTSIISTNFANEWDAFNKAQKLHQNRILQYNTDIRKQELTKIWRDANRSYRDINSGDNGNGTDGNEPQPDHDAEIPETPMIPDHGRRFRGDFDDIESLHEKTPVYMPRGTKMEPFEYERIIALTKKVESDLGIPAVNMTDVNYSSQINQHLVVNSMHSKLYNDAYGYLCQRMLMRLMTYKDFESVDDVASFLKLEPHEHRGPGPADIEKRELSVLEYRLLSFIYEKVDLKMNHTSRSPGAFSHSPTAEHSHLFRRRHGARHRTQRMESSPNIGEPSESKRWPSRMSPKGVKSSFGSAYKRFALPRTSTQQTVHDFMTLSLADDELAPRRPSKRGHGSKSTSHIKPSDISSPIPLLSSRSSSEFIDTRPTSPASPTQRVEVEPRDGGSLTTGRPAPPSPSVAIFIEPESADMSTESDPI